MKRIDLPDAVERYLAGETAKSIADSHGVSARVVRRIVSDAGVLRSNSESQRLRFGSPDPNDASIVAMYLEGRSEKAVAGHFGVSRGMIREALVRNGVAPRGRSESMYLRMSQTPKEGRLALAEAAHAAVRGVPQSDEHRFKVALGKQKALNNLGPAEAVFLEGLRTRGIEATPQKAVGRYNIDIALAGSSVAVEIFGGHWHGSGYHGARFRERTDYLLDRGWLPVIIWVTSQFPLTTKAVDYVVALHQLAGSNEPMRREEHVIRGDGEGGPISQGYPSCVPVIACYKAAADARRDDARSG